MYRVRCEATTRTCVCACVFDGNLLHLNRVRVRHRGQSMSMKSEIHLYTVSSSVSRLESRCVLHSARQFAVTRVANLCIFFALVAHSSS